MKARPGRAARRRPRTPANTRLVQALIARQDAISHRARQRISEILATHIDVASVESVWRRLSRTARARLGAIPDAYLELRPGVENPPAVRRVLTDLIQDALSDLVGDGKPLSSERPSDEQAPAVRRSRSLAEARAQCAELQSYLMNLKARIVPLRPRLGRAAAANSTNNGDAP